MFLGQAAQFLAAALPWPVPGSWADTPPFFVNVHAKGTWTDTASGRQITGFPGRACTSIDEATNFIEYRMSQDGGTDIYVCMAAQQLAKEKLNKRGRKYWNAIRKSGNAIWHKSLYIDVDVKEGGFATTAEAIEHFGRWRELSGLPPPSFVVMSGSGGFHAHWTFIEPIGTERWLKLAHQLVACMQALNFSPIDYGCSTDTVRLLRVPNTFNYKWVPPRPVTLQVARQDYLVDHLEQILAAYQHMPAANVPVRSTRPLGALLDPIFERRPPILLPSPLGAGIERNHIEADSLAAVCPLAADALTHGGKDHSQPLWHALAGVCVHVRDGREVFHEMSNGHPAYDDGSGTDQLYDRVEQDHFKLDTGWTTCAHLERSGSQQCATCPHHLAGRSPLNFAQEYQGVSAPPPVTGFQGSPTAPPPPPVTTPSATAVPPPPSNPFDFIPMGFTRRRDGSITADGKPDEAGNFDQVMCCNHPVWNLRAEFDADYDSHETVLFDTVIGTRNKQIAIPHSVLASAAALAMHMAMSGVPVNDAIYLKRFFVAYIDELRQRKLAAVPASSFGWQFDDGKPAAFALGPTRFNCVGNQPISLGDPVLRQQYTPIGKLEPWKACLPLLQGRPELEAIVATAFAGPLVHFTGHTGMMLCAYSPRSGARKSTSMKIAQSVYAHPISAMAALNDTENSVNKKLGMLRNIPFYYDEIQGDAQDKRWVRTIQGQTQGKTKNRLDHNSKLMEVQTWATMLVGASNQSMVGHINEQSPNTQAGMLRILEYEVDRSNVESPIDLDVANQLIGNLSNNYGRAGEIYAQFLGSNGDYVAAKVAEYQSFVFKQLQVSEPERFWAATVAILLAGTRFSNDLGLTQFDERKLFHFLSTVLNNLRGYRLNQTTDLDKPEVLADYLARFLNSTRGRVLITDSLAPPTVGVGARVNLVNFDEVSGRPNDAAWAARYAQLPRTLWIDKATFTKYLRDNHISSDTVLTRLATHFGMKSIGRKRITGGIPNKTSAAAQLLELDCNNPMLGGILDA